MSSASFAEIVYRNLLFGRANRIAESDQGSRCRLVAVVALEALLEHLLSLVRADYSERHGCRVTADSSSGATVFRLLHPLLDGVESLAGFLQRFRFVVLQEHGGQAETAIKIAWIALQTSAIAQVASAK